MPWANRVAVGRCLALALLVFALHGLPMRPALAQGGVPRFFSLTTASGLSHDIVYAIAQDRWGFLWFGTQNGLNRYDGYTFTIFRHLRSDPDSLAHNTVHALAVDSQGSLWVGTTAGLDRFDGATSRFVHYREVAEQVNTLYETPDGTLWVGTSGAGLFRYDRENDRLIPYGADWLTDTHILAICLDSAGTLWVGTEFGGLHAVRGAQDVAVYRHDDADPRSLPHDRITALAEDRAGTLWVGTGAYHEPAVGGLASLKRAGLTALSGFTVYRQGLTHAHITAVVEDRAGTLWVGTEDGLAVLDRATGRFAVYHHDPLDRYSLANDRIYALYEDRSGILWIATDGGISRYVPEKNRFALYRRDPQGRDSVGSGIVGAVMKDRDGIVWVGYHTGGLERLDRATGQIEGFRHDPADPNTVSHDHITALCQDRDGRIWVGTDAGVDALDPASGRFTHFTHDPNNPNSLGPGAVKVILQDRAGALWIGTEEPGTLSRLDAATGTFTVYASTGPGGLPPTYGIRAILEDRDGSLWLGTYSGLVHFDPVGGVFTSYRHDASNPASLSDDFVWSLYQQPDGTLWVATQGGLNRLRAETGEFTVYTIEDGLPNDGIAAIRGDESGCLWLATMGGGLSRFDPRTEEFRNYDVSDGVQAMHFIIGAAYSSPDGEMFFGGPGGLNAFYPAAITANPHVPPIVLTAFRKFDQVVDFGRDLTAVREIRLSYRDNFFSFEFAALDYADPTKNQYAYMLEGLDKDWAYCGTRRYAAYTNVPPGTYTFRVKGSNNDGVWNEEGLAIRVIITPPFWQTAWFRVAAACVALGVASVFTLARMRYVARLRRSEERFRMLFENAPVGVCEADLTHPQRLVHANPAFARLFQRDLEALRDVPMGELFSPQREPALEHICRAVAAGESATLEATGLRGDGSTFPMRISAAPGPGRNPRRCIVVVEDLTAEKARRSEEEAIAEERRRIAREIHDGLAQDMAALRLQVRRWQGLVDSNPTQAKAELEELHRFLGDEIREVRRAIFALRPVALDELGFWTALRQFLADFGEQNQLHISLEVRGGEGDPEAPRLPPHLEPALFRIIQEALNNVAKHAKARTVWVELDLSAGVVLRVRDDGTGFDPAALKEAARRGHLGLEQMRERVEALGGSLAVRSKPGQGTEIEVRLATKDMPR